MGIVDYLFFLFSLGFAFLAYSYALETIAHFMPLTSIASSSWFFLQYFLSSLDPLSVLVAIHLPVSATCEWHQEKKSSSQRR